MFIFDNRIDFENRDELAEYIDGAGCRTSGLSFSSLYMWREGNDFSYEIIEGYLCISGLSYLEIEDNLHFMFPPLSKDGKYERESLRKCIFAAKKKFEEKGEVFSIRLVSQDAKRHIEAAVPEIKWIDDRPNYDYIYDRDEITALRGKKFHAKKNYINSFKKNYEYEVEPITSDMTGELMEFIEVFVRSKELDEHDMMLLRVEMDSLRDVFENFERIGMTGVIIRIDGRIRAMAAGGFLGDDMVVEHIEKADRNIRGLYPMVFHQFCTGLPGNIRYINREEDMDIENLRKAKLSFKPCELIEKFIGVF